MQEIRSSNRPVVTGICDPNKSRARHHRNELIVLKVYNKETSTTSLTQHKETSTMALKQHNHSAY